MSPAIGGGIAVFALSLLLSVVVTPILLHRYRKAVEKLQMESSANSSGSAPEPNASDVHHPSTDSAITLQLIDRSKHRRGLSSHRSIDWQVWTKAIVYLLGGVAYALVVTSCWILLFDFGATESQVIFICYMLTFVAVVCIVATGSMLTTLAILTIYVFALFFAADMMWGTALSLLWKVNTIPLILMAVFLYRRVRSIGYMCAGFFFVTLLGSYGLRQLGQYQNKLHEWLGIGVFADFLLSLFIAAPIFAIIGWFFIRYIGDLYQQKRVSDEKLTVDTIVFTSAIGHALLFIPNGLGWMSMGLASFVAYFVVTWMLFRLFCVGATGEPGSLLYLRVFDLKAKGERFFNLFSKRWRSTGNINLISGVDLMKTTVGPDEFYQYVGGKISRRFVQDEQDLSDRISAIDEMPDPDNRYRINEFFCHADTWRMTMQKLSGRCDAVLMDLRSFSAKNRGCLYELEQLLNLIELERVILIVDESTDRQYLATQLNTLWEKLDTESPNAGRKEAVIKLFEYKWSFTGRYLQVLENELLASIADAKDGRNAIASAI